MPYRLFYIGIVLTILASLSLKEAKAQSISLSLSPPIVEIMIKPGKTISQTFTLENTGDDSLINAQIVPFDENGLILDSLSQNVNWLEIVSPALPFVLKKGEKASIVLKINPGEEIREQDYYQALVFKTSPPSERRSSQSNVLQALSALIFVSVTNSGLPKSAEVSYFNISDLIDSFSGVDIDIKIKNTGSSFFHPNGNIYLKSAIGEVKYPIINRVYLAGQEKELLIDNDNPRHIKGFFLGKYTLKADFTLDEGNIKITKEKSFYAFPYKFSLILIIIIALVYSLRKKIFTTMLLLLLIQSAFFISPENLMARENQSSASQVNIEADIKYGAIVRLYGYTSPFTLVQASSQRTYGRTVSDHQGYFSIENQAISEESSEICIFAIDNQNRTSYPVCLPISDSQTKRNIGPVFLPPTLSISHAFLQTGTKAYASGKSLPSSKITVSMFNKDHGLKGLEINSDETGSFSFSLPTYKSSFWRIYAGGIFNNNPTPKSQTIYFYIFPKGFLLFTKILPYLLWSATLICVFVLLNYYDKKSGNLRSLFSLIGMKLQPLALKAHLKHKLLWYNLRDLLRRGQKSLFHKRR